MTKTVSGARRRLYPNVSCITVPADAGPYDYEDISHFDVPLETYCDGNLTGSRLVLELLKAAREDEDFDILTPIIEQAAAEAAKADNPAHDMGSKRGAAIGFFFALQDVFKHAAERLDCAEVFKSNFDFYEQDLEQQLAKMRATNSALIFSISKPVPTTQGATA